MRTRWVSTLPSGKRHWNTDRFLSPSLSPSSQPFPPLLLFPSKGPMLWGAERQENLEPVALKMPPGVHAVTPPHRIHAIGGMKRAGRHGLTWNSKTPDLLLALRTNPLPIHSCHQDSYFRGHCAEEHCFNLSYTQGSHKYIFFSKGTRKAIMLSLFFAEKKAAFYFYVKELSRH